MQYLAYSNTLQPPQIAISQRNLVQCVALQQPQHDSQSTHTAAAPFDHVDFWLQHAEPEAHGGRLGCGWC